MRLCDRAFEPVVEIQCRIECNIHVHVIFDIKNFLPVNVHKNVSSQVFGEGGQ
jgi:hypothetical protein